MMKVGGPLGSGFFSSRHGKELSWSTDVEATGAAGRVEGVGGLVGVVNAGLGASDAMKAEE